MILFGGRECGGNGCEGIGYSMYILSCAVLLSCSVGVQTLEEWGCHALEPAAHPTQAQYNGPQGACNTVYIRTYMMQGALCTAHWYGDV